MIILLTPFCAYFSIYLYIRVGLTRFNNTIRSSILVDCEMCSMNTAFIIVAFVCLAKDPFANGHEDLKDASDGIGVSLSVTPIHSCDVQACPNDGIVRTLCMMCDQNNDSSMAPSSIKQPTSAPTAHPTRSPTQNPTPAPTEHACQDGSHGCDAASEGGICVQKPGGKYACKCAPAYKCVHGCEDDHTGHKCVLTPAPTLSPTSHPTGAPTKQPTSAPTAHPTRSPTQNPTPAPTEHACQDGSHGCDAASEGGICVQKPGGKYACKCAPAYKCVHGCEDDHTGHKCVLTPAPTLSPTSHPTGVPTKQPTSAPTAHPTRSVKVACICCIFLSQDDCKQIHVVSHTVNAGLMCVFSGMIGNVIHLVSALCSLCALCTFCKLGTHSVYLLYSLCH